MKISAMLAASLLGVSACSRLTSPPSVVCTTDLRYGLAVTVRDSVTNAFTASGALLIDVDQKGRADTSRTTNPPGMDSAALFGAPEHAGTFTVTVRKAGYHDWVRHGVVVTADECHVRTTTLTALLQPSS